MRFLRRLCIIFVSATLFDPFSPKVSNHDFKLLNIRFLNGVWFRFLTFFAEDLPYSSLTLVPLNVNKGDRAVLTVYFLPPKQSDLLGRAFGRGSDLHSSSVAIQHNFNLSKFTVIQ